MLIYLAALPKDAVDSLLSTLRKAGLSPYLLDLKPLAIARTSPEARAIIIDLQPSSLDIVIISEGVPQVVRSLPLSWEASLERKIAVITEELGRVVTFYNSSHMDRPIGATIPLLVSGELVEQDTQDMLSAKVAYPIQVLPSPMKANEEFPASQYATCIGLALKEVLTGEKGAVAYSRVNFNALPEVYLPKVRPLSEILFRPVIIAGIALIALGAFFSFTTYMHNNTLRAELAAINQLAISRHVTVQDIIALRGQVASAEVERDGFSAALSGLKTGRDKVNSDLAAINSALPGSVSLSSVSYGSSITVTGKGNSKEAVFRYAKNLRASPNFSLAVITSMDNKGSFTIVLSK
jgi:hypothetical protein